MTQLSGALGLDIVTFGLVVVMATAGAWMLRQMIDSNFLMLIFYPALAGAALLFNYAAQATGVTLPFARPGDEIDDIAQISVDAFMTTSTVTFAGILVGLALLFAIYKRYGHFI